MKKLNIIPAVLLAFVVVLCAGACVRDDSSSEGVSSGEEEKNAGQASYTRDIEAEEVFSEAQEPEDDEELIYFTPEEYELYERDHE